MRIRTHIPRFGDACAECETRERYERAIEALQSPGNSPRAPLLRLNRHAFVLLISDRISSAENHIRINQNETKPDQGRPGPIPKDSDV